MYRYKILEKLLKENEMIKYSNDIFQILYEKYFKIDKFKESGENILEGKDDIILKNIEDNLSKNFVLEETIFYLFEKNSMIYIQTFLEKNNLDDDEPLEILNKCIKSLDEYIDNNNKQKKKKDSKLKE